MSGSVISKHCEDVRNLIAERLKIKGKTLEMALAKAGRLLPSWAHRDGAYLVQAQRNMTHPKLHLMVDADKADKVHAALVAYLKTIDPKERRKTRILGILGVVSFNLILLIAALVIYLIWRGFL